MGSSCIAGSHWSSLLLLVLAMTSLARFMMVISSGFPMLTGPSTFDSISLMMPSIRSFT